MSVSENSVAILPTGSRINPSAPEGAKYFESGDVLYVVRNADDKLRVVKSSGGLGLFVDSEFSAHHDQRGASFGTLAVVGIRAEDGTVIGEVPDKSLALRVVK